MKRMIAWALLAATVLAAAAVRAEGLDAEFLTMPRKGVAVCAPKDGGEETPLYDEAGGVSMRYFSGTRVQVISVDAEHDRVYVAVGEEKGGQIKGYMQADELRYGPAALRETPYIRMEATLTEDGDVLRAPSESATYSCRAEMGWRLNFVGYNDDGWLQIEPEEYDGDVWRTGAWENGDDPSYRGGFIHAGDEVTDTEIVEANRYVLLPTAKEQTHEQAYESAVALLAQTDEGRAELAERLPGVAPTEENVRALMADVRLSCDEHRNVYWSITFQDEQTGECVVVELTPTGEWIRFTYSNG